MIFYPWMYRVLALGYAIFGAVAVYMARTTGDTQYYAVLVIGIMGVIIFLFCVKDAKKYWNKA